LPVAIGLHTPLLPPPFRSGSHVALRLVNKYPRYRIVVVDKLDCTWLGVSNLILCVCGGS